MSQFKDNAKQTENGLFEIINFCLHKRSLK